MQDGFVPYWTAPGPVYAPGCGAAGWGGYSPYGAIDAYEQGRYDADHEYIWHIASQRAGLLLDQHAEMFDEGLIEFREGRYDRALLNMIGAAEKNHTSAAARLHAAHALFALGRYSEARDYLARAFELKPGLEHKMFDLRDEYGDPTLFDGQLARLRQHVGKHPNDAAALTVLGYAYYYTRGPGSARGALERAARLDPDSFFIPKLLRLARMTSGIQPNSSPSAIAGRPRQSESAPAAIESRRPAGTIRRVRADGVVERL